MTNLMDIVPLLAIARNRPLARWIRSILEDESGNLIWSRIAIFVLVVVALFVLRYFRKRDAA